MSTAMTVVDRETGEVVAHREFDFPAYVASLGAQGVQRQQALAAAYDNAVRALIGPNDVQQAEGREFKKKSAWRKLARHFQISTAIIGEPRLTWQGDEFVAVVTVRATAPWGQFAEDIGACGTDEATGKREISWADAVATATTRATNRAVSNLIAMGEVSAEEIGPKRQAPRTAPSSAPAPGGGPVMPFGKSKGTPLAQVATADLNGALQWARDKGKFEEFQNDAVLELEQRAMQGDPEAA